jgi:uncharacterized protein (UPF0332 family)
VTPRDAAIRQMLLKARRKLAAAKRSLDAQDSDDASSRAYYAAFHAVSAVLWRRGLTYSSHAQTLGAFNRECVASGEFPKEFTRILARLFDDRQLGDYDAAHSIERETAERDVADAPRRRAMREVPRTSYERPGRIASAPVRRSSHPTPWSPDRVLVIAFA